ncbi:MAG: DUF4391 domain-containing protein [Magnetococcales bacterium]|nr:DUF4391 domain-containing protein [Magnetococcales bacterium]
MDAELLISALGLPVEARLDRRIAKKLLLEHGAATTADRRLIQEGVEALYWVAAIKAGTVALPAYRDAVREVVELAVIQAEWRANSRESRLMTLIHRAIPYPLLLLANGTEGCTLSLALKRFALGESGKVVLDGEVIAEKLLRHDGLEGEFLSSLAISRQKASDLHALYRGWMIRLLALTAARLTGNPAVLLTEEADCQRRNALQRHQALTQKLARLRTQAAKESLLNRRVALNLEIDSLRKTLAGVLESLRQIDAGQAE